MPPASEVSKLDNKCENKKYDQEAFKQYAGSCNTKYEGLLTNTKYR